MDRSDLVADMPDHLNGNNVHPLVQALPPATDYLTYLTLVEYNLRLEDLPLLNDVLQDVTLTVNIGWDLVMLLLPMLPASETCLQTIARLGNPREVLIKVTEALRLIDHDIPSPLQDGESFESIAQGKIKIEDKTDPKPIESSTELPLPVIQFKTLVDMLCALHARIKTKYPSRFISTTLQAVLVSFSAAQSHLDEMTRTLLELARALSGTKRPQLPPRQSSNLAPKVTASTTAADPEAQAVDGLEEDKKIQKRLLEAFITHAFEVYLTSLASADDIPGLAWSARLFEKMFPGKTVPRRVTFSAKFAPGGELEGRSSVAGDFLSTAHDIGLDLESLVEAALLPSLQPESSNDDEGDPPNSADDIPLSHNGALLMLAARSVASVLFNSDNGVPALSIFPGQAKLTQQFIGREEAGGKGSAGSEPEAIIDSIVALGLLSLHANDIGEPDSDEAFMQYLQTLSLLSANTPSPSLRFHAHTLTSLVLRSHPSDVVRLTFIRDTLEHCPYENLKASAVSWIKGETLEANPQYLASAQNDNMTSIFASPVALETLRPFLFPDLTQVLGSQSLIENWIGFRMSLSFYLAALNFYYLLLAAEHLHEPLDIASLNSEQDISDSMLIPLREVAESFRESLKGGDLADQEGPGGVEVAMLDLDVLDDILDRINQALVELNNR